MPVIIYRLLLCCIVAFFSHQNLFGQGKADIQWTRPNLLAADTIWKFRGGIARKGDFSRTLNDSNWNSGAVYYPGLYGPPSWWPGIGVFRKYFKVPDSLRGRQLELLFSQVGASEIYVDGLQISQLGQVSPEGNLETISRNSLTIQSVPFRIDSLADHVLSVYYSNHSDSSIMKRIGVAGIEIIVTPYNPYFSGISETVIHGTISLGIILSFCLFFWFVFAFYPFRLASVFSALLLTNFALIFSGGMIRDCSESNTLLVIGDQMWRIGFCLNSGWNVLFLYAIYYRRLPKRSWIVALLMITATTIALSYSTFPWQPIIPIVILFDLEILRMIVIGLWKKRNGFWILAIGTLVSMAGTLTAIFDIFNLFPWYLTSTQTILAIVTDLSFPLTMALQFAWEFGSANRDLGKQIVNVKDLSAKTLEQEQEKQELLSRQNEILEKQVKDRTQVVVTQKKEIEKQRDNATGMLDELRATQKQLIQSEKMASLGELTAGIAHEIQNPLNFVNNFSELNCELIDDLNEEIEAGNLTEVKAIAGNLKENSSKITHHGRRAESIVKGMLQHSRKNSGQRELVDINDLADEYLRLSYHGFRAKEKDFNARLETNFDEQAGMINIVRQDIGRVLLNLFSNAFFALGEQKKQKQPDFDAVLTVSTKHIGKAMEIRVRDNGSGIPPHVLDKIFQPFFTTKAAGQGTGLGLSLSYDIVKSHGGELRVTTEEGKGTEFIIDLPGGN